MSRQRFCRRVAGAGFYTRTRDEFLLVLEHVMGTDSPDRVGSAVGSVRSPLDVADATFQLLTCEPGGLALDCTGLHPDLPQHMVGLLQLRDLLCSRTVPTAALDAVWRVLAARARTDGPCWLIAAVGMAVPALRSIAASTTRGYAAGDPHDLDTEVLTGFLEALHHIDLDRPGIRPRLCSAGRRAGERARRTAESGVCRRLPARACTAPKPPWNHPDFVLFDAVAKGVVSDLDAELIGRTRLEELTLAQAAAELGLSMEAAKKRRQRAEPVLCAAIQAGEVRSRLSPTITFSVPRRVGAQASVRDRVTSDTRPVTTEPKGGWGAIPGPARTPIPRPAPILLPTVAVTRLYPCGPPPPVAHRSRSPRRRRFRRMAVVGVALLLLLAVAVTAHAQPLPTPPSPRHLGHLAAQPKSLNEVITNLRNWLIGFLAALATLMATIGGLRYLLAGGDPSEVAKAKNTLKFAALGYAIAALAPLLVAAIKSIVGV